MPALESRRKLLGLHLVGSREPGLPPTRRHSKTIRKSLGAPKRWRQRVLEFKASLA